MSKRFAYTSDVTRCHNLCSLAWDVWQAAPDEHSMAIALEAFLDEAYALHDDINRCPFQVAVQRLNVIELCPVKSRQTQWFPHPIQGWTPGAGPFGSSQFEIRAACDRLIAAANEHLNPRRNDDTHMFRPQWKWQETNNYY